MTPVKAQGDVVPSPSLVPLLLEEARDIGNPVPIVSPPNTWEKVMRDMVSIHECLLESGVDTRKD